MHTLQDLVDSLEHRDFVAASWRDTAHNRQFLTSGGFHERILPFANGLRNAGFDKGEKIALLADNNPFWLIASLGVNYAGLVDVPRGSDTSDEEFRYILEHSDASGIIVQNQKLYERVMYMKPKHIDRVISLQKGAGVDIDDILSIGLFSSYRLEKVSPEDIASIIYTSGTTGEPKGVMLSHENYIENSKALIRMLGDLSKDEFISILPPWHVFGRGEKHLALLAGSGMYYSSIKTLLKDLKEVKPTVMVSVPRLWESVYEKFQENPKIQKIDKLPTDWLRTKLKGYALKKALGGRMRFVVSGGGGLSQHIDEFFIKHGVIILEGYGMTEMAPVISSRRLEEYAFAAVMGTVGKPLDNVEVQIRSPDGALLDYNQEGIIFVNGPNRMLGYYKRPQETKEVIGLDGFLDTGDLGYQKPEGNIVISGRKKNEIVLSNGENIKPEKLEQLISSNPYISQVMVVGEHWDEQKQKNVSWQGLGALVAPHLEHVQQYLKEHFNKDVALEEVLHLKEAKDFVHEQIKQVLAQAKQLKPFEKINSVYLVDAFEVGKELTATFKIRRNEVLRTFRKDEVYALAKFLA